MRVLVSVDMEGIAGVVDGEDVSPGHGEADREAIRPLRFDGPVQLEVEVLRPHMTERALLIPGIERTGGCTLRYPAPDFPTAYRIAQLIIMLGGI